MPHALMPSCFVNLSPDRFYHCSYDPTAINRSSVSGPRTYPGGAPMVPYGLLRNRRGPRAALSQLH